MNHNLQGRLLLGCVIIIIGVLALIDNLHIFDTVRIVLFWPAIFILVGVLRISQKRSPSSIFIGGGFILVGAAMILRDLGLISFHVRDLWPLILIGVGLMVIFKDKMRDDLQWGKERGRRSEEHAPTSKIVAFMSGNEVKNSSQNFQGGEVVAIMGGVDLDLRSASLDAGATLDVFAFWGGVQIKVPSDWSVTSDCIPLLGGVEDKTQPPLEPVKRLRIKGMVVMGGISIKN
jgi:predicted membrane protein